MITVRIEGVDRFQRLMRSFKRKLPTMTDAKVRDMAKRTRTWLQDQIRNSGLDIPANAAAYAAKKSGKPPLINTEDYVKGFMIEKLGRRSYKLKPGVGYEDIGMWLEFGTARMPPRPHFRAAQDYVDRDLGPAVVKELLDESEKALRS